MNCPYCNNPVQFIQHENRYYCTPCRQYFTLGAQAPPPVHEEMILTEQTGPEILPGIQRDNIVLDPNDEIIGVIEKSTSAPDYTPYALFFTPSRVYIVLLPRHMTNLGNSRSSGLVALNMAIMAANAGKVKKAKRDSASFIGNTTHGVQLSSFFKNIEVYEKTDIASIKLKKGMASTYVKLELPPDIGLFG